MFVWFANVTSKFDIQIIVNKSQLKINVYNNKFRCFNNNMNIFQKFSSTIIIFHNVILFFDCSYNRRIEFFKTFTKNTYLFVDVFVKFNKTFLIFNKMIIYYVNAISRKQIYKFWQIIFVFFILIMFLTRSIKLFIFRK